MMQVQLLGREGVEKPPKGAFQTIFSERTDLVDNIKRFLVMLAHITFYLSTSENPIQASLKFLDCHAR